MLLILLYIYLIFHLIFYFLFVKIYLQPIGYLSFSKSTNSHTLFLFIDSNSSYIHSFYLFKFEEDMTCEKVNESFNSSSLMSVKNVFPMSWVFIYLFINSFSLVISNKSINHIGFLASIISSKYVASIFFFYYFHLTIILINNKSISNWIFRTSYKCVF